MSDTDIERWRELNRMLHETEELMGEPLRFICLGAGILFAGALAFFVAAFWGPFGWVDFALGLVATVAGVAIERESRRQWWADQRMLEDLAVQIRADMRRCVGDGQ